GNYDLLLKGDGSDTITINAADSQTTVTLDGQTFVFSNFTDGGQIRNITVDLAGGSNTVNLQSLAADQALTIVGGGSDTFNLGLSGSGQGNRGNGIMDNPPSHSTVNVDDSADTVARTVTVDGVLLPGDSDAFGRIVGLAPGNIMYEFFDTNAVNISTGSGATVNVQVTNSFTVTNLIGHGQTTVNVGEAGSLAFIHGDVNVSNPPSYTTLNVDDHADTGGHTVTITNAAITGLAPAKIGYQQLDLAALTITGSQGSSTYNVQSTPSNAVVHPATSLVNRGTDTVNVGNAGS